MKREYVPGCDWKFKIGDRVVVVDTLDSAGVSEDWNEKALGMEGEVIHVDNSDDFVPYRVRLDEQHPDHLMEDDQRFWFREHNLQRVVTP